MPDRALHVGVDGRELMGHPTGTGRYLSELLQRWAAAGLPHRFTIVAHGDPPASFTLPASWTWRTLRRRTAGTWWEQHHLTRALADANVDVLFAPAYTAPIRARCPVVLAIHDVSYFAHPEWFSWREGLRRRLVTRWSADRARAIVTLSRFSASEIARFISVPAERVHVIPPGSPAAPPSAAAGPREPLVLYAGTLFVRRHLPELIAGFAETARRVPAARLVMVGENRATPPIDPVAIAARLGVGDRVQLIGYASDAELEALYRRARVFAFLSEYEGFGLTPLEAIARGTPAVLLDAPVMRDVYGDSATFVTLDAASISRALAPLLTDDIAAAAAIERGRRVLDRYSWDRAAADTLTVLEEAARP